MIAGRAERCQTPAVDGRVFTPDVDLGIDSVIVGERRWRLVSMYLHTHLHGSSGVAIGRPRRHPCTARSVRSIRLPLARHREVVSDAEPVAGRISPSPVAMGLGRGAELLEGVGQDFVGGHRCTPVERGLRL